MLFCLSVIFMRPCFMDSSVMVVKRVGAYEVCVPEGSAAKVFKGISMCGEIQDFYLKEAEPNK